MKSSRATRHTNRRGTVAVFACFLLVTTVAMAAFALDLGYLTIAEAELQRSADSAAMAAAWELIDQAPPGSPVDLTAEIVSARTVASQYVGLNKVCNAAPTLSPNNGNATSGDVVIGYMANPSQSGAAMTFGSPNLYNSVQVTVRRTSNQNGEVPYFFARIFGLQGHAASAQATAALINNFGGLRAPSGGGNLDLLPFALDEQTWDALIDSGTGTDSWTYNATTKAVASGSDGVKEVNLFPQGTGSPGNRGTVDIGGSNNSTADIARQIVYGVSPADLSHFPNGELRFNSDGKLYLNGDTGISAGVKDELASIIGKPRMIPIFRSVTGPGNNATYTIVKFVGIRIVDVHLTGSMSSKHVMIQPAHVFTRGAIPGGATPTSYSVYSPVWLVR